MTCFIEVAGAQAGDLFMSLIHTCQPAGVNPPDCLTGLLKKAARLATAPEHNTCPGSYARQLIFLPRREA